MVMSNSTPRPHAQSSQSVTSPFRNVPIVLAICLFAAGAVLNLHAASVATWDFGGDVDPLNPGTAAFTPAPTTTAPNLSVPSMLSGAGAIVDNPLLTANAGPNNKYPSVRMTFVATTVDLATAVANNSYIEF